MAGFTPDTSCMVAAVCAWHEHHERAAAELNRRLRRESMLLAAPALVESYAVLTRLPPPHRLSPQDALDILEASFLAAGETIALDGTAYQALLRAAPQRGVAGGRIYDTVIAQCALKGRATALLTFNEAHFASFARAGLAIIVP